MIVREAYIELEVVRGVITNLALLNGPHSYLRPKTLTDSIATFDCPRLSYCCSCSVDTCRWEGRRQ